MVDSNRMNRMAEKILEETGIAYKVAKPPVVEEFEFFDIQYRLDHDSPSGGYYQAIYKQTWDEEFNDLVDMQLVYGATVMEVISELMTALGRPIKADEWELGYDEREDRS